MPYVVGFVFFAGKGRKDMEGKIRRNTRHRSVSYMGYALMLGMRDERATHQERAGRLDLAGHWLDMDGTRWDETGWTRNTPHLLCISARTQAR